MAIRGLFVTKPIIPTSKSSRAMNAYILNALIASRKQMIEELEKVTATWNHEVRFEYYVTYAGGDARVHIFTADRPFNYLDGGTVTRHAAMTRDFIPKTRPRWVGSGPGRGGVAHVSKNLNLPGIKARHFYATVRQSVEPEFKLNIYNAVQKGLAVGGWR